MTDQFQARFARAHFRALALLAIAALLPATLILVPSRANAGEFGGGSESAAFAERSCKWTAKEEHCDWVKKDKKLAPGH